MAEQTIAELYGLNQDDPWDKRSDQQKAIDARINALRDSFEPPVPPVPTEMLDPDDDENLVIRADAPGRVFYRLSMTSLKLAALLSLEPSLINISANARNTAAGCWVALTARRVAQQMAKRIQTHGYTVTLATVDGSGIVLSSLTDDEREAVIQSFAKNT